MTELPDSWALKPLRDLCLPITKTDPVETGRATIRYIDIGSVDGASHSMGDAPEIQALGAPSRCRQIVKSGDTLFSTVRPYLEKIAYVGDALDGQFASTGFAVLRPGPDLHPKYLYYYSISRGMLDQVLTHQKGVSYPAVLDSEVRGTTVPVPRLAEQQRIVELLEDHLSRLDAAEHGLVQSGRSTASLVMSVLARGLRGELVEDDLGEGTAEDVLGFRPDFDATGSDRVWAVPDGWLWARLGDVFEVNVGATPPRGDASAWAGALPWVSSGEVTFSRISQTREHITREAAGNPAKRIHPAGTVMLAMIGEGKTRGQAAILDIEASHNQNCASIRVSATRVLPEYVYGYLEERYLETRRAGSGGQQQALNKAAIQRFPIPIPPLTTQRMIVDAWDGVRSVAARLDDEVARASLRSASLRRSLLDAAFSGRLTGASFGSESA